LHCTIHQRLAGLQRINVKRIALDDGDSCISPPHAAFRQCSVRGFAPRVDANVTLEQHQRPAMYA
jgi:hypothetical protein